MMYCENCGKQISDDANVCPYCGQPTSSPAAASPIAHAAFSAGSLQNKTVAGMSIFRFALCVFGALHVLGFFFLSSTTRASSPRKVSPALSPLTTQSKKQLLFPVWQAAPFCSTCIKRQSLSQSKAAEITFCV